LNQNLKTAVGAAAGNTFALGGEIITLDADINTDEDSFSFSSGLPSDVQLLLTVGTGDLSMVGLLHGQQSDFHRPLGPITNAGFAPLLIGNIATQNFAGLRILFLDDIFWRSKRAVVIPPVRDQKLGQRRRAIDRSRSQRGASDTESVPHRNSWFGHRQFRSGKPRCACPGDDTGDGGTFRSGQ